MDKQQNRCCISSRNEIFKISRFNHHEVFEKLIVGNYFLYWHNGQEKLIIRSCTICWARCQVGSLWSIATIQKIQKVCNIEFLQQSVSTQKVCNILLCNILILLKNLATFFCNKIVAKNCVLQQLKLLQRKRPLLQKKNLWL